MVKEFARPLASPAVRGLLIANVAVYLFEILPGIGRIVLHWGALVPYETFTGLQVWRLMTYLFLHDAATPFHLLFNLLALWMFGEEIESTWGSRRFFWFYMICGIGAGCFSLFHLFSPAMSMVPVIGASGAVLGLLTAYAVLFPHRQVLLFFVVPVNIRVVVIGFALLSLFGTISSHGVVAHLTHLGGIIVAIVYLKWYPFISGRLKENAAYRRERHMRRGAEATASKRRFFEEEIDPILAKISRVGSGALTAREKRLLKSVATSEDAEYVKKNKILPFDLFR
jgi:membrane associated rhomboid family serine protease